MNREAIEELKKYISEKKNTEKVEISVLQLNRVIKALEQDDFARWVAKEIFDDEWEYNKDAFAEIACRKLAKLGIVRAKGDEWELVELEPCKDEISRQAAKKILEDRFMELQKRHDDKRYETNYCLNTILELPSVNPQPKTGHWIIKDGKEQGYDIAGIKTWYIQIMCDKCGFIKTAIEGHTGHYKYCPNCGCHMVEPQESENKE